ETVLPELTSRQDLWLIGRAHLQGQEGLHADDRAHRQDRPGREVRAAQGQRAAGREEPRVLRALQRSPAGRREGGVVADAAG
ncbi:MAG: hypothetical protein OXF20_04510, partial [Gammaproteobacteria bacterium]|nr:hypothetical protein [Gammaproteobacteria bacterium]